MCILMTFSTRRSRSSVSELLLKSANDQASQASIRSHVSSSLAYICAYVTTGDGYSIQQIRQIQLVAFNAAREEYVC